MKCLDSSFIIDFFRKKPNAIKKADEIKEEKVITTSVNFFEVILGELKVHSKPDLHLEMAREFFDRIEVFDITKSSAFKAAQIGAELSRKGNEINSEDLLIAGVMLSNGCKDIITADEDFKKIKEINVEKY